MQKRRFEQLGSPSITTNAQCPVALIEQVAQPDGPGLSLLQQASEQMRFSARAYHRVLKVARTLADLDGQETVGRIHLAESISYRMAADTINEAA